MEKNVAIVVAGAQGQEIKDLAIKPGTLARDVLKALGLERYAISKADGKLFGPRDNVYEAVGDGEKLYATTEAEVGLIPDPRFFLSGLRLWWDRALRNRTAPRVTLRHTRTVMPNAASAPDSIVAKPLIMSERIAVGPQLRLPFDSLQITTVGPQDHGKVIRVNRDASPYWQDKGWIRAGDTYTGLFGSNGHRWSGTIIWGVCGLRGCYVANPPRGLWKHPHARCFSSAGDGGYSVHFNRRPQTVDATIIAVEQILEEAAKGRA